MQHSAQAEFTWLRLSPSTGLALLWAGLLAVGLYTLWRIFSQRARVRRLTREVSALRDQAGSRATALEETEREIARLRRVPRAEMLPMLQLAHELRSPLSAAQSALDMLLQGYATTSLELQNEMLILARDRVETMLTRINDFLRLGAVRREEGDSALQRVRLTQILSRLAPEMRVRARWKAVEIEFDVPESVPPVRGTVDDMEYLLSNLISNAVKYTNPGGVISVSLQERAEGVIGAVSDTGIGIPPEDLPHIFDEFYRAQQAKDMDSHGSGLGLSIVKRVVERYGGQLTVESKLGKGSTFAFVFPKLEATE